MKKWQLPVLFTVVTSVVLSSCAVAAERTRGEIVRNYLAQNQKFGESPKSLPIPTTLDFRWSHGVAGAYAGALAGALGLEWPPPLNENDGPHDASTLRAYCSWNWRYCLLALTSRGWEGARQTRCCLIDTLGQIGWVRDLVLFEGFAISDSGTVALFTRERDSLITTFMDASGQMLGRWACSDRELIMAKTEPHDLGNLVFMPDSERLFMLINPRKHAPWFPDTARQYIRCVRTDGRVIWQYDLGESATNQLAFPGDGAVIALGTQERQPSMQSASRLYDNEFFVLNAHGHLISHIQRTCPEEIVRSWLVTYESRYLYFIADKVEVLDLHTGRLLTQVPLQPLYNELSRSMGRRGAVAERLVRRQLGLAMSDSIPPLR